MDFATEEDETAISFEFRGARGPWLSESFFAVGKSMQSCERGGRKCQAAQTDNTTDEQVISVSLASRRVQLCLAAVVATFLMLLLSIGYLVMDRGHWRDRYMELVRRNVLGPMPPFPRQNQAFLAVPPPPKAAFPSVPALPFFDPDPEPEPRHEPPQPETEQEPESHHHSCGARIGEDGNIISTCWFKVQLGDCGKELVNDPLQWSYDRVAHIGSTLVEDARQLKDTLAFAVSHTCNAVGSALDALTSAAY